ncbi:flagellar hook-associated protein FlgK [Virgisporangium aurantiacum]|uniref:flagellar hook-associated protein FlgK n=1 Tax=Virgisporangium aurantiacum TaxID=175570 RepID=UPI0023B348A1|nr:flagellar hook-associated protein FlgK [Virgisporangium aurantiacum]
MSSFRGISASLTALHANQRAMEVSANNIANVNTEGYTRQRVNMTEIGGPSVPGMYSQARAIGDGVIIDNVERLRDQFLESRGRVEHGQQAYLQGTQRTLAGIETAFAEPGDTALQAQLGDMWNAFADVANKPEDEAVRSALVVRSTLVADTLRNTSGQLESVWDTTYNELESMVSEVNATARTVADLNKSIVMNGNLGQPANDLSDRRDMAAMKLVEMTGGTVLNRPDGSLDIMVGGSMLVGGSTTREILPPSGAHTVDDAKAGTLVDLRWADGTNPKVTTSSGKLGANLESLNSTLPTYSKGLDEVAKDLAATVNATHAKGQTDAGVAGGTYFGSGSTDPVDASNIRMDITAPKDLAMADLGVTPGAKDGTNADRMADLAKDPNGPNARYKRLVVDLGVQTQAANRRVDIQTGIVGDVDAQRAGESGVNIDEEMTNLVQFERGYQAAAKVITTIDEMLDTLINRM